MGSARLQKDGVAVFCRFPVHCTDQARETLKGVNSFGWVVPYHTPAHPLGGVGRRRGRPSRPAKHGPPG